VQIENLDGSFFSSLLQLSLVFLLTCLLYLISRSRVLSEAFFSPYLCHLTYGSIRGRWSSGKYVGTTCLRAAGSSPLCEYSGV
jgi:hypothetical protein